MVLLGGNIVLLDPQRDRTAKETSSFSIGQMMELATKAHNDGLDEAHESRLEFSSTPRKYSVNVLATVGRKLQTCRVFAKHIGKRSYRSIQKCTPPYLFNEAVEQKLRNAVAHSNADKKAASGKGKKDHEEPGPTKKNVSAMSKKKSVKKSHKERRDRVRSLGRERSCDVGKSGVRRGKNRRSSREDDTSGRELTGERNDRKRTRDSDGESSSAHHALVSRTKIRRLNPIVKANRRVSPIAESSSDDDTELNIRGTGRRLEPVQPPQLCEDDNYSTDKTSVSRTSQELRKQRVTKREGRTDALDH
ncbi:zinc finger protein [Gracilaria domingensis]|nr:zinc finger protein [Gracilaria domingensis]